MCKSIQTLMHWRRSENLRKACTGDSMLPWKVQRETEFIEPIVMTDPLGPANPSIHLDGEYRWVPVE